MKTAVIELAVQLADDYLKQTLTNTLRGIDLPQQQYRQQSVSLENNVPVTLPGSRDAVVTIITSEKPIKVSAIIGNSPVDFPVSITPLILSGPVTNIALTSTYDERVNAFVFQGA